MESAQTEEARLIARVKAGEAECFLDLVQPHARGIYLLAYSVLRNAADAEDAAQETVFKAFRHLQQWRGEGSFKSWLLRIAMNEARMLLRRDRGRPSVSLDEPQEGADGEFMPREFSDWREIPSETLERKEVRAQLLRAVERLPPHYREAFLLRDVQHLSEKEAADVLDVTVNSVKMRLHRARLQLREDLAPIFKKRWSDRLPRFRSQPW